MQRFTIHRSGIALLSIMQHYFLRRSQLAETKTFGTLASSNLQSNQQVW